LARIGSFVSFAGSSTRLVITAVKEPKMAIPINIVMPATILPKVVCGAISPYPTVVIVSIHHHTAFAGLSIWPRPFSAIRIAMLEKITVIPVNNRIAKVAVWRLLRVSSRINVAADFTPLE
jgi:hypothetical protein